MKRIIEFDCFLLEMFGLLQPSLEKLCLCNKKSSLQAFGSLFKVIQLAAV